MDETWNLINVGNWGWTHSSTWYFSCTGRLDLRLSRWWNDEGQRRELQPQQCWLDQLEFARELRLAETGRPDGLLPL
jgi:hypothetical protein